MKSQNEGASYAYNDVNRGIGNDPNNHLLQRVVRLQSELHRKELEVDALKDQLDPNPNVSYFKSIQNALDASEREKAELQSWNSVIVHCCILLKNPIVHLSEYGKNCRKGAEYNRHGLSIFICIVHGRVRVARRGGGAEAFPF